MSNRLLMILLTREGKKENDGFVLRLETVSSREHRQHEEQQVFVTSGPIYQYSCQKLNASENALEQMRIYLKEVR